MEQASSIARPTAAVDLNPNLLHLATRLNGTRFGLPTLRRKPVSIIERKKGRAF